MDMEACNVKFRIISVALLVVVTVVGLSLVSSRLWQEKPESAGDKSDSIVSISSDMTVRKIADAYGLNPESLKGPLGLMSPTDLDKTIAELGLSVDEARGRLRGTKALANEESSKNWFKIPLKFVLWIAFLSIVFRLMLRGSVSPSSRKILLMLAIGMFGVALGSDPSPMGTVKDTIVLWGTERVIFPPRIVALAVFLLMVILANKFICSWGCQFGVLQDLVFRINRNHTDTSGLIRQGKPPFGLTNSIRMAFFVVICVFSIAWAKDIVSPIDPFGVFKPAKLGTAGTGFVGLMLVASLFVYRPWCHLFCPFGLVSWVFERFSFHKIKVDYGTCVACEECARACPSTVMDAILKQDKAVPDCFSCGTCQGVCPTNSITFGRGSRAKPPVDKFRRKQ
jgi:NAD-dependent dihydropyrimidine dehydrogenase PreA subunit